MSLHARRASAGVSTEKPGFRAWRRLPARPARIRLALLMLGIVACGAGGVPAARAAVPPPDVPMEARARSRAWAVPGAAWHYLLVAREAPHDAEGNAIAVANYRIAAQLDPDLVEAWLGLAMRSFPGDMGVASEGTIGAIHAASRSWEARRRIAAAILPALWLATLLAASALLLGVGLRHIRPYRHRLQEAFRTHLDRRRAGWLATFICLIPLGLQWGLASAAAAYAGLIHRELSSREKGAIFLALVWFCVMPTAWSRLSEWSRPILPDEPAWIIDRAQREVPTPALDRTIRLGATAHPSAEAYFARGMFERRDGDLKDALADFQRAVVESSAAVAAHAGVNIGNVELWTNDPEGAARAYERILDQPYAGVEARYNLAIALSRLRRFEEADQQLEAAQKLDFDRVRSASRTGDPHATADVMDGILAPRELDSIARSSEKREAEPVPPATAFLLPGGRPSAAVLAVIVSIVLGAVAGSLMRKRLSVHTCHQCGAPVCRHCVIRSVGRASCARCAESRGAMPQTEYSRILLHRVLGRGQDAGDRIRATATYLLPGIALVVRGRTWSGCVLSWLFAFGVILATRAAWTFPPSASIESSETVLRVSGAALALLAWTISCAVARRVIHVRSLRRFLERDAYRVAA